MPSLYKRMRDNIEKERLLSVSNFAVMTIAFLVLGIFISLVVTTQTAIRNLEQQAQLTIYFKDDFPEDNILKLQETLTSDERIQEANYVSKEDAYVLFTELNKDEPILLDSVTASILPASIEIRTFKLGDLKMISDEYSQLDGVESVKFFESVINNFRIWSNVIYVVGIVLVIVFFVISYSIILATLRTTIHSKGTEYEIMKLVGARDDYVKKPLLFQGMFFGFASSVLATLIIFIIVAVSSFKGVLGSVSFAFLYSVSIHPLVYTLILGFILVASGIGLGYLGSHTAVKKYLEY